MFQRLLDLSRTLPERQLWERINQGMPAEYNRGVRGRGAFHGGRAGPWPGTQVGGMP